MKKTLLLAAAALTVGVTATLARQDAQESGYNDEMMMAGKPGKMHQKLEPLVGNWNFTGKFRMAPDAPWMEFGGTMQREWIMDGRFVQEKVESEFQGAPFHGMGLVGYDNLREEYVSVWVENVKTGMDYATGHLDESASKPTIVFEGTVSDSMTGDPERWSRSAVIIDSNDRHVLKMWSRSESGEEYQTFELVGTRK